MADDKKIKLIIKKLQSNNVEEVLFTIKQIRNTGSPKILPFLIDLLYTSKSEKIKSTIQSLLNDLKNKDCTSEIVKALKNEKYKKIHHLLLSSCWQSGLDYSEHLELFVNLFITGDFGVAFEAFTILDNSEDKYEAEAIDIQISNLKSNISGFTGSQKEGLFVELVHVLESLKR
jgi:hypothetical protein